MPVENEGGQTPVRDQIHFMGYNSPFSLHSRNITSILTPDSVLFILNAIYCLSSEKINFAMVLQPTNPSYLSKTKIPVSRDIYFP